MLVSQWRELIAIKRQWEKGTLKHRLVSYVINYDKGYFLEYVRLILEEFKKRNIRYNQNLYSEIDDFCNPRINNKYSTYSEHNDRYLAQCYFNLQEKYDRGIVSEEEWVKINVYIKYLNKEGELNDRN